jgi:hypothetical protein
VVEIPIVREVWNSQAAGAAFVRCSAPVVGQTDGPRGEHRLPPTMPAVICIAYIDKEPEMAYGVIHQFPGGTREQYEASIAAVHPSGGALPEGQILHVAGPSADGWTIVAVHDSRESWERFRNEVLMPRMGAGIAGGFTAPPQETLFEVYAEVTA